MGSAEIKFGALPNSPGAGKRKCCGIDIELAGITARRGLHRTGAAAAICGILQRLPGNNVGTEAVAVTSRKERIRGAERIVLDVNRAAALVLLNAGDRPTSYHLVDGSAVIQEALAVAQGKLIGVAK
jgi:hypothetical protein